MSLLGLLVTVSLHAQGTFEVVREDDRGLYVEAALSNSPTPWMQDIRWKVAEGALRSLSMGGVFHYGQDGKAIQKLTLREGGRTPVPANPDAVFSTRALTEAEARKADSEATPGGPQLDDFVP